MVLYRLLGKGNIPQSLAERNPDISFSDVVDSDQWFYEPVMYLAKAGVVDGWDGGFWPDKNLLPDQLERMVVEFVSALGPATIDSDTEIAVSDKNEPIRNKVFNGKVTVVGNDDESEPWNPDIRFENCTFNSGLNVLLGSVSYNVNLRGCSFEQDSNIEVGAKEGTTPDNYDNRVSVNLSDVPNGTTINSSVCVNVNSTESNGTFTLNGVTVYGGNDIAEYEWFSASMWLSCFEAEGTHRENHASCTQSIATLSFGGKVGLIDTSKAAGLSGKKLLQYNMNGDVWNDVVLALATFEESYVDVPVRITGGGINNNSSLIVIGVVTGRNVEVTGKADISTLNVSLGDIYISAPGIREQRLISEAKQ
jgi:hypothetical protein